MGTTTKYQLPWPEATDALDGPNGVGNLARREDDVILNQVWTPLDDRLKTLEAKPAAGGWPTAQNGQVNLTSDVALPAKTWVTVLQTPSLAVGTWLLLSQSMIAPTGNATWVTERIMGSTADVSSCLGGPDVAGVSEYGWLQLTMLALVTLTAPDVYSLQANADNGNLKAAAQAGTSNPQGPTATLLSWIKLA
jgi:hypothetical protein